MRHVLQGGTDSRLSLRRFVVAFNGMRSSMPESAESACPGSNRLGILVLSASVGHVARGAASWALECDRPGVLSGGLTDGHTAIAVLASGAVRIHAATGRQRQCLPFRRLREWWRVLRGSCR